MGKYTNAISSYEKALEIYQKTQPQDNSLMATSYNNIGMAYMNGNEYSKALSYFQKDLEISEKFFLQTIHHWPQHITTKSVEINEKLLSANHPTLAASYNNIGATFTNTGDYPKALLFYEKARLILEKCLPQNHPNIAVSKANIEELKKKL